MSSKDNRTIIIGAGLAGLSAATALHAKNLPFFLVEAETSADGLPLSIFGAGDYTQHPSIQGALLSGEKAAERAESYALK